MTTQQNTHQLKKEMRELKALRTAILTGERNDFTEEQVNFKINIIRKQLGEGTEVSNDEKAVVNDTPTSFRIKNYAGLITVMSEIVELNDKAEELTETFEELVKPIKEWYDNEMAQIERNRDWREKQIIDYHKQRLDENPKDKTLSTPFGVIKSKAHKATVKKPDKDLLMAIFEANDYDKFIKQKVTHEPDWAGYKENLHIVDGKVFDMNGLVLDDIEVIPAHTTFKVEVTK